ncbi:MAG: outer membrane beta-barrel protein [Candidatus Baltobacteraceae bacterium]
MLLAFLLATVAAMSPSPSPAPTPTPTPVPAYSVDGAFSLYYVHTNNVNATGALDTPSGVDLANRTDNSEALLTLSKNAGVLRFSLTGGAYAFPVVGQAINPTTQPSSNSCLYGFVPLAAVQYVPSTHLTVSVGKQSTLLGQESAFTAQNLNVQRGLGFALEPTISRGGRAIYTNGKFTGDLEYNDGYYSGNGGRAIEGLVGWAPSAATNVQFAFIAPGGNTPGNVTASVANKREYDLMLTQQVGKLLLLPYLLFANTPASPKLGYTRSENALVAVLLANYAFGNAYSIAGRYEAFTQSSAAGDSSLNADLLGFGAGSNATSWTITPAYKVNTFFARAEYSLVNVTGFKPGLAFGPLGTGANQSRVVVELGVQF